MNYEITWPSGLTTVESSETLTADAYAMERWGLNSAAEVAEHGVLISATDRDVFGEIAARKERDIEVEKARIAMMSPEELKSAQIAAAKAAILAAA